MHMQKRLVKELGSLDNVWQSESLNEALLSLPFPAVQLLLASDDLEVCAGHLVVQCVCSCIWWVSSATRPSGSPASFRRSFDRQRYMTAVGVVLPLCLQVCSEDTVLFVAQQDAQGFEHSSPGDDKQLSQVEQHLSELVCGVHTSHCFVSAQQLHHQMCLWWAC